MPATMPEHPLRLDIVPVLPGAASLGAYQAGATAAIAIGRNALVRNGHDVGIPAIGGASAGATVAMLAAHSLAHAIDPVAILHAAWVAGVDLDVLTTGTTAPLGHDALRTKLADLLTSEAEFAPIAGVGPSDVDIHISLTTLRGYRYGLDDLGSRPTDAVTYADWEDVRYPAGGDAAELVTADERSLLDVVIASLANPAVFPPVLLDRSEAADDPDDRRVQAVGSDRWWFSDGGLVQSRPIQRTLDLVERDGQHVHCVVIDPRSEGPTAGDEWADPDRKDDWLGAFVRAMSIFPAQVVSDELRRLDEENRVRQALRELAHVLSGIEDAEMAGWIDAHAIDGADDRLVGALLAAAGIESPHEVRADAITPLIIADGEDVPELLAGELLGDFAGFLDEDLRQSDFSLGYACGTAWWLATLDEYGLEAECDTLDQALTEAGPAPWNEVRRGRIQLGELPWSARMGLARVLGRAIRAIARR